MSTGAIEPSFGPLPSLQAVLARHVAIVAKRRIEVRLLPLAAWRHARSRTRSAPGARSVIGLHVHTVRSECRLPQVAVWSRPDTIATLRRRASRGPVLFNNLEASLRRSILFHWGGMTKARTAIGLPRLTPPRQKWSRDRVLAEIRTLDRAGQHLSANALLRAGRNDLVVAAAKYAGSWTRARELAGIRFKRHRPRATNAWDAATVVASIRDRHERELPLAVTKAPRALVNAANRIFGAWRDAIEAAGIDYETVLLARTYSDEQVLAWLRQLARRCSRMTLWDLDKYGEHAVVCRRRWGSYEAAARAAGIEDWPIRTRPSRALARWCGAGTQGAPHGRPPHPYPGRPQEPGRPLADQQHASPLRVVGRRPRGGRARCGTFEGEALAEDEMRVR